MTQRHEQLDSFRGGVDATRAGRGPDLFGDDERKRRGELGAEAAKPDGVDLPQPGELPETGHGAVERVDEDGITGRRYLCMDALAEWDALPSGETERVLGETA